MPARPGPRLHGLVMLVSRETGGRGTTVEVADPRNGAVGVLSYWPGVGVGRPPFVSFDSTYRRLAAERPGTVGFRTPNGAYTPVGRAAPPPGDVVPLSVSPNVAYLHDRLVDLTPSGRLRDARTRRPVPGYPVMRGRGLQPAVSPYGTLSMLTSPDTCAPDPSRPGGAVCEPGAVAGGNGDGLIATDGRGRAVRGFGHVDLNTESVCGVAPDGAALVCGWHPGAGDSLASVDPTGDRTDLTTDIGARIMGTPVFSPDRQEVAAVVSPNPDARNRRLELRIVRDGRVRRPPVTVAPGTYPVIVTWD